jgi:CCR4-NOT transcription complex subunit 3
MEQFKACEKDTKLKSFPKDGISRESRNDPKEAEREDKRAWLNSCVERLENLIETINSEIEKIGAKTKGKNKDQVFVNLDNSVMI